MTGNSAPEFSTARVAAGSQQRRRVLWIPALGSSLQRDSPRSHDAAGGMESLAGGACALGEVGWTFGSVASYNVTKCDMRRPMCRSAVSVNECCAIEPGDIPNAHNFGRSRARAGSAPVTRLALRPCQRLHDGAGDKQRDDRDELADEDRPIQVDRRAPLGLAILDHPCPGGARANAEA